MTLEIKTIKPNCPAYHSYGTFYSWNPIGNTEPLIRILVEGKEEFVVNKVTAKLMKQLKEIISVK